MGWVVGTDWPQADERKLFKLSDDLVLAARHVVAGADGAGSRLTENVRGEWDGNALNAFVKRVNQQVGGRQAMLVQKLIGLAIALNELGVQVQYTKRMIKLAVLLFIVQMFWLAWALLNPAGRLTATALMGVRAQTARWTVRQFAQRLVMNVAMFGVLMGGMDYYIQKSQTRRDGMDGKQLLSSMGMGALTGAGLTALAWAVPTKSMWMLMGHSGIASAGATLVSEIMTGGPIDWTLVAKGGTAGIAGGADAHWASWSPGGPHLPGREAPGGTTLADAGPRNFVDVVDKMFTGDERVLVPRDDVTEAGADGSRPLITPRSTEFDPGLRTPLLPTRDSSTLAQFSGDRARTIDPAQAVRASEWNDLRQQAPVAGFGKRFDHAPFERSSQVEVRRMVVDRPDGGHAVTEATVKVRYKAEPGMSQERVNALKSQVLDGVDLNFNHQHRLSDGSQFHVRVEFEEAPGARLGADDVVTFKETGRRADMLTWHADASPGTHAHELGHHLGLVDEYVDPVEWGRRGLTDQETRLDGSLYASGRRPTWGNGSQMIVDHNGFEISRDTGILDRHLNLIEDRMERGRVVEGPGAERRGAESYARPELSEENVRLPPHVAALLERFPPPEGVDFLTHALLLDKAHGLFPDSRITQAMLDRTQALFDIAKVVYQADPAALRGPDIARLHALTSAFDPQRIPDAIWLADKVSQVVERPGRPVRPYDVEALSRIVRGSEQAGGARRPGEGGVDYVRRVAAEFLGTEVNPSSGRMAAHVFNYAVEGSETLARGRVAYGDLVAELRQEFPRGGFDGYDVVRAVERLTSTVERSDPATPPAAPRFGDEPTTFTGDEGSLAPPADISPPRDGNSPPVTPRTLELDHGRRVPLVPVHDPAALAQLRGDRATTIDPMHAVRAADWDDLREWTPPGDFQSRWPKNPVWEGSSQVEVRRMNVVRDGVRYPITEATITFRYVAESGMSPERVAALKAQALDGVDLYFNHQHRLSDGSQFHVRVEFEEAPTGIPVGHGSVISFREGNARASMLTWYADGTMRTHAHEVGHHLGLGDEYTRHGVPGLRTVSGPGMDLTHGLYGNASLLSWTSGRVLDHTGMDVLPISGLLDQHLTTIEEHFGQPGPRTGKPAWGEPGPVEQHVRPGYTRDQLQVPDHVAELLERFPPPGDRDFLSHAMLLDWASVLYEGEHITQFHVDRTEAILATGAKIYGATQEAVPLSDVFRLKSLVDHFDSHRLPDGAWLTDQIAQVVGGTDRVTPRAVDGLARLAYWFDDAGSRTRLPGESGHEVLARAAREFLGDPAARPDAAARVLVGAAELSPAFAADKVSLRRLTEELRDRFPDGGFTARDVAWAADDLARTPRDPSGTPPPDIAFTERPSTFESRPGDPAPHVDHASGKSGGDSAPIVAPRSLDFDPGQRTPLLPVHDAAALAQLRGERVTTVDPATAVRAAEWDQLRQQAQAEPFGVRERIPGGDSQSSTVEVRRMSVLREDGWRAVTELTVRIRYVAEPGVTPEHVAVIKSNTLDGIDLFYNHQHRLSDGSQLHVRVEFEETPGAKPGDLNVVTFKEGSGRANSLTWYAVDSLGIHAHEVGHHLGLPDQYVEAAAPGRRTIGSRNLDNSANLMGNGERIWTRFGMIRDHNGVEVLPVTGLRDGHLDIIEDLIPRGQITEGLGAEPTPARPYSRPDHTVDTLRLRPWLAEQLNRFPPPEGVDVLTQVLLLDKVSSLYGDSRLHQGMVDRTRALVDIAGKLYGAVPSAVSGTEIIHLNRLALSFDPRRPPDAAWLTQQLSEVLGGPEKVTPRAVDAMARLTQSAYEMGNLRWPDETGVGYVNRIAAEFLREDATPTTGRRAAAIYATALELSGPLAAGEVNPHLLASRLKALYIDGGFFGEDVARVANQITWDLNRRPAGQPIAESAFEPAPTPRSAELDPGRRTPLLPVHDPVVLAELRGERATTIDPALAVRASEWEDLRQRTPVRGVDHAPWGTKAPLAAPVEVRRMSVVREDGQAHAVTEATVTFRYAPEPGVTPERAAFLKSQVLDGVDLYFNHQHRLSDGSQLHVRVEFEEVTGPKDAGVVTFHEGNSRPDWLRWNIDNGVQTHAHEVGHHLGLFDEYTDADVQGRRTVTSRFVLNDTNLYGDGVFGVWSTNERVLDHTGMEVPSVTGLRDRHLDAMERVMQPGEFTEAPAGARGPAEPHPRPVATAADLRLPAHVEALMERFPPPEGRDPTTHALILDRAHWLNNGRPLTEPMIERTVALFQTAKDLYGTNPPAVSFADLNRLNSLSRILDPHRLPDAAWLLQQVDQLIDGPVKANPRLVEGMGHLVDWFHQLRDEVLPGETGQATLTRAAASLLDTEPGPVTNRRAAVNFAYAAENSEAIASGRVNWARVSNALWDQFEGQGGFTGADMAAVAERVTRPATPPRHTGDAPQTQGQHIPHEPRSRELDPGLRPPLVPVHDPSALAQLRGDLSTTLDPATAPRASEWQDLRPRADRQVVQGRWQGEHPDWEKSSRVEVRRMRVGDQPVTEFTVRVRYVAEPGLTPDQAMLMKSEALDGVDLYFNHQHRLPDGSQLHVRLEFQEWRGGTPGANDVVTFRRGSGAANMLDWYAEMGPQVHAHELGHHLNLGDAYRDSDAVGRRTIAGSGMDLTASLYGNSDRLAWLGGDSVLDHTGHVVTAVQGLRDRQLADLGTLVDHDRRVASGEPGYRQSAEEHVRPTHTPDTLRMPEHVRALVERYPPPEGVDLVTHARQLDWAHRMFEGIGVPRLGVDYVGALYDIGHGMFGAVREAFIAEDLFRMHHLVHLMDPGGTLPDTAWVAATAAEALGGEQHVHRYSIDGLTRVAEWFKDTGGARRPGEQGVDVVQRAAAEFLGRPPGPETTLRAANLLHLATERSWALSGNQLTMADLTAAMRERWPDGEGITAGDLAKLADDTALANLPATTWRPEQPPMVGDGRSATPGSAR
ncbi:hypothetical protein OIE66_35015 [Nonomuraea sp. NBC_01738]|uniref:WXG100-like domain-containing protein n=1 Tax=Nonomuraea sp. NBC_01738 TaxID=2976003 RepID=UPI002E0E9F11|nr:hypothetical protein OIE66_35015 [Nonomuraea sp. NBC_01738]